MKIHQGNISNCKISDAVLFRNPKLYRDNIFKFQKQNLFIFIKNSNQILLIDKKC